MLGVPLMILEFMVISDGHSDFQTTDAVKSAADR